MQDDLPPPPPTDPRPVAEQPLPERPSAKQAGVGRPLVAAIAAATAVTLLTGIGWATSRRDDPGAAPADPAVVSPDTRSISAILEGRARAVRDRDSQAFRATVFAAPAAFQATQRQLFDNLTRLPLQSWQEDLGSAQPVATGAGTATFKITLSYRLRGFDRGQVIRTRYLTVGRRGADWVLVGDGAAHGMRDDAEMWDGGPLTVVRGKHSLVVGNAAHGLREIAGRIDTAVPAVANVVGSRWARHAVAVVPQDDTLAAAMVGQGQNLQDIAALATVAPGAQDGRGGEDRIVVTPTTFAKLNGLGRGVVLTHELTHVATGGARDGRTPLWLIEGLADYVGYKGVKVTVRSAARELRREIKAGRLPARLPTKEDFAGGSGRMPAIYEEAWLACRMIAAQYGEDDLLRLYRAAGRQSEAAAFHATLRMTPAEFVAQWRAYLKKELQ